MNKDLYKQRGYKVNMKLKLALAFLDLSYRRLGSICGVSRATVRMWVKGVCTPNSENMAVLEDVLGVDRSFLFDVNISAACVIDIMESKHNPTSEW